MSVKGTYNKSFGSSEQKLQVTNTGVKYNLSNHHYSQVAYHIYSNNGSKCFLNFQTLRVGTYSRLALKINFYHFHKEVSFFCNKTINRNQLQRCMEAELKQDDIAVETLTKIRILIECQTTNNLEIVSQLRNNNQHSSCALQLLGGERGVGTY